MWLVNIQKYFNSKWLNFFLSPLTKKYQADHSENQRTWEFQTVFLYCSRITPSECMTHQQISFLLISQRCNDFIDAVPTFWRLSIIGWCWGLTWWTNMMRMSLSSARASTVFSVAWSSADFAIEVSASSVQQTTLMFTLRNASAMKPMSSVLLFPFDKNLSFDVYGTLSGCIFMSWQNSFCRRRWVWSLVDEL